MLGSPLAVAVHLAAFGNILNGSRKVGFNDGDLSGTSNLNASGAIFAVIDGLDGSKSGRLTEKGQLQSTLLLLELVDKLDFKIINVQLRAVNLHTGFDVVGADVLRDGLNGESAGSPVDTGVGIVSGRLD